MPVKLFSLLAAALCLPGIGIGQTSIQANQLVELSTHAPLDAQADHAVVAVNTQGDVLVAWSSALHPRPHALSDKRRVEAAFFRRTSTDTWDMYPTQIIGESDEAALPGGNPVFPNGDICRKADVVAVGDNFLVAWQRIEDDGTENGQIECCYIEVPATGDMVPHLADSAGIGYVLDPAVDCRTAGAMVDLAYDATAATPFFAVYCSRTSLTPLGYGNAYDFDLRGVGFDFPVPGAPTVYPAQTLRTGIAFDDFAPTLPYGGRILPDTVFDQFGNVVIALEEFKRGDRVGGGALDEGYIHLERWSMGAGGVLNQLNVQVLSGLNPVNSVRRPNLARLPGNDDVCLAFGELDIVTNASDIYHYSLVYPDSVADAAISDHAPNLLPNINEDVPVPFQYRNIRGVLITGEPQVGGRRIGYQLTISGQWQILNDFTSVAPLRPAVDVLEDDPLRPNHGVVPVTVEGRPSAGAELRTFIEILLP